MNTYSHDTQVYDTQPEEQMEYQVAQEIIPEQPPQKGGAMQSLPIALALLVGSIIIGIVGFNFASSYQNYTESTVRNQAIDGCMQNSQFSWAEPSRQNPEFMNTTKEPSRYWYKICMEEKGQQIIVNLE